MKKIISAVICALMLAPLAAVPAAATGDVKPVFSVSADKYTDLAADWYREAAEKYGYSDIFTDGSLFRPEQTVTRMQFVRMLHRALGININYFAATDITKHFTDVKNEDAGAGDLYDFVTAGIAEPGGKFNPGEPLTREVMIHWLIAALDYKTGGDYAMIMIMPLPFDDDSQITETYKSEVTKSVILGLIKGRGDNKLFPRDGATRAEAVAVADRLVKLSDRLTRGVGVAAAASENGGALEMTLTISNNTDKTVKIDHASGQKYDFMIYGAGGETLYTWSADKMFMAMTGTTEIAAGDKLVFSETLSADAYAAIKDKAVSVRAYIIGTSSDFTVDHDGYEAHIG